MTKVKAKLKTKTELKPKKPLAKAVEKVRVQPLTKGEIAKYYNHNGKFYVAKRDFVAYKKAETDDLDGEVIITLHIKKGTKFYVGEEACMIEVDNDTVRKHWKCRALKATVINIIDVDTGKRLKTAWSGYNNAYKYKVGTIARPVLPFEKEARTCASGIHFFMTKEAAKKYPI